MKQEEDRGSKSKVMVAGKNKETTDVAQTLPFPLPWNGEEHCGRIAPHFLALHTHTENLGLICQKNSLLYPKRYTCRKEAVDVAFTL